jgi:hypothetical protein
VGPFGHGLHVPSVPSCWHLQLVALVASRVARSLGIAVASSNGSIAYEELVRGELSEAGYSELLRAASAAMRTSRGRAAASELGPLLEDPAELVSELTRSRALHRLVQQAQDGTHFARSLVGAFAYQLTDLARKTAAGALVLRINNMLRNNHQFSQVPDGPNKNSWIIAEVDVDAIWNQDENALVNATWELELQTVTEWAGNRRTPLCTDEDLVQLLHTVISRAGAPLPASGIIRTLRHRFGLLYTDPSTLDEAIPYAQVPGSVEEEAISALEARRVLETLTPEETVILESGELTDRELGEKLGCSKSTANVKRLRLREQLEILGWTDADDSSSDHGDRPTGEEP